jgi:hypothetical protein
LDPTTNGGFRDASFPSAVLTPAATGAFAHQPPSRIHRGWPWLAFAAVERSIDPERFVTARWAIATLVNQDAGYAGIGQAARLWPGAPATSGPLPAGIC